MRKQFNEDEQPLADLVQLLGVHTGCQRRDSKYGLLLKVFPYRGGQGKTEPPQKTEVVGTLRIEVLGTDM